MKVALAIAGLSPEFGGPSRSVPALATALAHENVNVELLTCASQKGHEPPLLPDSKIVRTHLLPVRSRNGGWRAAQNDFFRTLSEIAGGGDDLVIHDNGLWLPTNHAVVNAARHLRKPLVISARGMLSARAAEHHEWKKRIAWLLFQRRDFFNASLLHATSDLELNDLRNVGFRGPIALVPNGTVAPSVDATVPVRRTSHVALCMTRLHPIKGLMNLIEAWGEVRPHGWRMLIAGPDEGGHRTELQSAITRHQLDDIFYFLGPVDEDRKQALYRNADLFLLPSHSENFGMGIAEALSHGLPVITTQGTPWKDLLDYRCGWWEAIGVAPLASALRAAMQLSDTERSEMGRRGRELIEQKYSWQRVAAKMKSVYQWLLDGRDRPDCVVTS